MVHQLSSSGAWAEDARQAGTGPVSNWGLGCAAFFPGALVLEEACRHQGFILLPSQLAEEIINPVNSEAFGLTLSVREVSVEEIINHFIHGVSFCSGLVWD